jgi:hypothetical protein
VPASDVVTVQVAVAVALRVAVDEVHALIPAVPFTVQFTVPVGAAQPAGPSTVAVKVRLLPRVVGAELVTTLLGVALPTSTMTEVVEVFPATSVAVILTVVDPSAVSGSERGSWAPVADPLWDCCPDSV